MSKSIRARTMRLLASVAIGAAVLTLTPLLGIWPAAPAQAQYVIDAEFRTALSPYGRWHHHSRWGEVWLPDPVPADWRPYTRGRWIYTDDWGWYWESGDEEAAWGWVTNHYGRWVNDRELGWLWVPGEDWGPAWVDWRHGDDYVGWAPLPPDDLLVEYRDDPVYWSFVRPRYLLSPRVYLVFVPPRDRIVIIRRTKIVNRTVIVDRDRNRDRDPRRARVAVNAGIEPAIIARATGKPIRASKVEPAVLRGTKVEGTREVDAKEGRRARATIRTTNTVIEPARKVERPRELGAHDKGRVGERLSERHGRDAGNADGDGNRRSTDNNRGSAENRASGDQDRSPPINVIRGGISADNGRNGSSPSVSKERERKEITQTRSAPPPPAARERGEAARANFLPPSPAARRSPPPSVVRASPPPPAVSQRRAPETQGRGGSNGPNNRQQDDRPRNR